ncbi:3'-5' exonuclease [candidate division KSB1 bacterium]|nr:3'-5' exonuclease [candidate division KSB1 bacterium]
MYLFFDTETTGLPKNYNAPISDVHNWPRLVQLAWSIYDKNETLIEENDYIIKPVGFTIPANVVRIHGITTEIALSKGVPIIDVLARFRTAVSRVNYLIAHNVSYDLNILGAEFMRMKTDIPFPGVRQVCTMKSTADYCKIPGTYGYKWPNLNELYMTLFHEPLAGAHNALSDVRACAKSFFELKRRGVL